MSPHRAPALRLSRVSFRRGDRVILDNVDWIVGQGERWAVLGPNGSGKTTLCRVASLYQHPSDGRVEVLGEALGRTDVRELRRRIGLTSAALADMLRPTITSLDVVMTARHAALAPHWHVYTDQDRRKAEALLDRVGCGAFGARAFGTLSSGERQRVLLARTLMTEPDLLLLDEPTAGLDLGGREALIGALGDLAREAGPATIMVTHHVDEIPPGFTHGLLLRGGRVQASGPLDAVLTEPRLSACFDVPLRLARRDGRWFAWLAS